MKTWLITGCSTGLGVALAKAALARGDNVMLTSRDPKNLAVLASHYPATARATVLDVTDPDSVAHAIDEAETAFGSVDVFVNNAEFGVIGAVEEISPAEYRQMFETNVFGLIEATRAALPAMRRSRGIIVNLSSDAGIASRAGFGLYSATKFAAEAVSEALAAEVRPFGIKVLIVEPGVFCTDFFDRSMTSAATRMDIYDESAAEIRDFGAHMAGKQKGDPAKAVEVILKAVDVPDSPLRLPLGPDAHRSIKAKIVSVIEDIEAWSDVTTATNFAEPVA